MKTLSLAGMILAHTFYALGHPEVNFAFFFWVAPCFAAIVGINALLHTSNPKKYAFRLLGWAFVTQPVHVWFFGPSWWYVPNVLFGLSAVAFLVTYKDRLPDLKLPPVVFYAAYPAHFILIKFLVTVTA